MGMIFGNIMKTLFGLALALCVGLAPVVANAEHDSGVSIGDSFYGGWKASRSVQGNIMLGDGQGWGIDLRSTELYCGTPGAGYSTMQKFIRSNSSAVSWFVDDICNRTVRVCVYADWGDVACSSYLDYGWRPF